MAAAPLTLRPIVPDDFGALAALWHRGWQIGHADIVPAGLFKFRYIAGFRTRIERDPTSFLIAERREAMVGFLRIVGAELDQFYVAPDQIGTGVAAPLMRAAEATLAARGVVQAHLIASVGNDRAVRFYEKNGWTNRGVEMAEVTAGDGTFSLDVIRFEKTVGG
ncbi:MAG: GNAT family N-acetyltransferase [Pseudomonadota bacterium]